MRRIIAVIMFTFLIGGCAIACKPGSEVLSARLDYEGGATYIANFSETESGRGRVWGELFGGEAFEGKYVTVNNRDETLSFLKTPWGSIQLGVSNTTIGSPSTQITAIGNQGTQIRCVSFPRGYHGRGYCLDSNGRRYQLYY